MMWQTIETAPKGATREIKCGKGTRDAHEPEYVILALGEGRQVLKSRWLPEDGRWEGVSKKNNTAIAWMPWPDHPHA